MEVLKHSPAAGGGEDLQELAPGVFFMDTLDRGVKGYAGGWLVAGQRGYALVESGAGAAVPRWLAALTAAAIPLDQVEWVLVTHVHLDHAGGAGELLRHLPRARLGVHPDGIRHLVNPERLLSQARQAWGDDFHLLGEMQPAPAERVVGLADGEIIDLGGPRLRVVYTPGHTPHHVIYFEETSRGVFSGDALGAIFGGADPFGEFITIPGISPPVGDIPRYLDSIRRIADLGPQRIYAAHFGLWEPALPLVHLAAGQISLLWELCREVRQAGGGLPDVQRRLAELLAATRRSNRGGEELVKNFSAMMTSAWNYVVAQQ